MKPFKHFKGVYFKKKANTLHLYTLSPYPPNKKISRSEYGEKIIKENGMFFREWDPKRSKLSAALHRGISQIAIQPGKRVLYLGAATGTTVSHVSDIVGNKGKVFAVEFSPRVATSLYFLAKRRGNIIPILEDARNPLSYVLLVGKCDVIYQDIAQKDQLEIFFKNVTYFLREDGFGVLCLKARSIDVAKKSRSVFKWAEKELAKEMKIVDKKELAPFEKDHMFFVVKRK